MRITILATCGSGADATFPLVVGQVAAALRKGGQRVSLLGVHADIGKLISALRRRQPDLVFNLIERSKGDDLCDAGVLGLLDLLGVPYTGSGPGEMYIQRDRSLAATLLAADGVTLDGVGTADDGRRFCVGMLGNKEPMFFPPVEMPCYPAPAPLANGRGFSGHDARNGDGHGPAVDHLADRVKSRVQEVSRSAGRALQVRDYGQITLHVKEGGDPELASADSRCCLKEDGVFARGAAAAGIDYVQLVNQIAELALERSTTRQELSGDQLARRQFI